MNHKEISVSLMCAPKFDFKYLLDFIIEQEALLHIDIMSRDFVECEGLDYSSVFSACSKIKKAKYDVHIMAKHPEVFIDECIIQGCDFISFHIEGEQDTKLQINKIIRAGLKAGLSVRPDTDITAILDYLPQIDLINIMTVYPGYAGQKFQKSALSKVVFLSNYRKQNNLDYIIEVDGSCNSHNIYAIESAGTDRFVVGASGLFDLSKNIEQAWSLMDSYMSQKRTVFLHADLAGNPIKEHVKEWLIKQEMHFLDLYSGGGDEYPECARFLCKKTLESPYNIGILCCGTGIGMSIVANKIPNIRAAVVSDAYSAKMAKEHNDCNILCLGSRVVTREIAFMILDSFFESCYQYGKHTPRVDRYEQY